MNMTTQLEMSVIALEQIRAAHVESAKTHQPVCKVLEESLCLPPEQFTAVLGATLHFPVLGMEALHRLEPAFRCHPVCRGGGAWVPCAAQCRRSVAGGVRRSVRYALAGMGRRTCAAASRMVSGAPVRYCGLHDAARRKHACNGQRDRQQRQHRAQRPARRRSFAQEHRRRDQHRG